MCGCCGTAFVTLTADIDTSDGKSSFLGYLADSQGSRLAYLLAPPGDVGLPHRSNGLPEGISASPLVFPAPKE